MSLQQLLNNDSSEPSFNSLKFDDAAFESFFKKNFILFCAYCQYKFGFDIDLAKEVVHTGFIKVWETFKGNSSDLPVKPYLYKIITNNCLDIIKHQKVTQNYQRKVLEKKTPNSSLSDFSTFEFKQLENNINKAIAELPEQMRKIFMLSRYEGLKYSEIANQLNISVKTVETQMSRALIKLRQMLSDYF